MFQSFGLLWHWANHYLAGDTRLSIVTCWRRSELIMVWPLVARRRAFLKELVWMGAPIAQYGDVLIDDCADATSLLRHGLAFVRSLGADVIHLRKTRCDTLIAPLLIEEGAISTEASAAPYLDLARAQSFAEYEKSYPAKLRSSRRRHLRRLEETGAIRFEQCPQGEGADQLVRHALKLKRTWLEHRGVVSPSLTDPRFELFFRDVGSGRERSPELRFAVVRRDGEPIAVEMSFVCKGHVYGHVLAYDVAFAKQGLGAILAGYSIRTAHEQGYRRFDLLAPSDAYKMDWADDTVAVDDWAMPLSTTGRLFVRAWLCGARPALKSAATRLARQIARIKQPKAVSGEADAGSPRKVRKSKS